MSRSQSKFEDIKKNIQGTAVMGIGTGGKRMSANENIRKTVEQVWAEFDTDGNGVLDHDEAKNFFDKILISM